MNQKQKITIKLEAYECLKEKLGPLHCETLITEFELAHFFSDAKMEKKAYPHFLHVYQSIKYLKNYVDNEYLEEIVDNYIYSCAAMGKIEEIIKLSPSLIETIKKKGEVIELQDYLILDVIAKAYLKANNSFKALEYYKLAYKYAEEQVNYFPIPPYVINAIVNYAGALNSIGKIGKAKAIIQSLVDDIDKFTNQLSQNFDEEFFINDPEIIHLLSYKYIFNYILQILDGEKFFDFNSILTNEDCIEFVQKQSNVLFENIIEENKHLNFKKK